MPAHPLGGVSGAPSRPPEHSADPSLVPDPASAPAPDPASAPARRSLVRAAVWSAPLVAAALAAPAAAASASAPSSGPTSTLVFDTWQNNVHWDGTGRRTGIDTRVQVQNRYWTGAGYSVVGAPVPTLSVRVRYPVSSGVGAAPTTLTGSGWRFSTVVSGGDVVDYVFTWSGAALAPSRSTPELVYTLSAVVPGPVQVSAVSWAPNADPVAAPSWGDSVY